MNTPTTQKRSFPKANLKFLLLALFVSTFAYSTPAQACWFIFCFFTPKTTNTGQVCPQHDWYNPRAADGAHYNRACRFTRTDAEGARQRMRKAGTNIVKQQGQCYYRENNCVDCPGPEHDEILYSPGGRKIKIQKADKGQNRLQPGIIKVLGAIADKKGKNLLVTSAYRSCDYQKKTRQGVRNSQHLKGNAADFVFENDGSSSSSLAQFARQTLNSIGLSHIGGTGTYCTGSAHVDTGNKRQWNWRTRRGGCRRR